MLRTGNKKNQLQKKSISFSFFKLFKLKKNSSPKIVNNSEHPDSINRPSKHNDSKALDSTTHELQHNDNNDDIELENKHSKKNSTLMSKINLRFQARNPHALDDFLYDFSAPKIPPMIFEYNKFEINLPVGYDIVSLPKLSEEKYNSGCLLYDIDDTLIYVKDTIESGRLKIYPKDKLIKELKEAQRKKLLLGIITARVHSEHQFHRGLISITDILEVIGTHFFKFIIFTNNQSKAPAMEALKRYYNFSYNQMCIVDDDFIQLQWCKKFKTINSKNGLRHEETMLYIKNPLEFVNLHHHDDLPPPLEFCGKDLPDSVEPIEVEESSYDLRVINNITYSLATCFIFTKELLHKKLTKELIDFFKTAAANHCAFILVTDIKHDKLEFKKSLSEFPLLAKYFYAIGYSNSNPSYQELLEQIIEYTYLSPEKIVFVGELKQTIQYRDALKFQTISFSSTYVQDLAKAIPYFEEEKTRERASNIVSTPEPDRCAFSLK